MAGFIHSRLKASTPPQLRLRISPKAETILRGGHPWLFADSLRETNRDGRTGELAVIYDRKDCFLGIGLFDPASPIRVRMLHAGKPVKLDRAWWSKHLAQTLERRSTLFDKQTTGYRLCNGESDGWPGFIIDRYDSTLVLKLYTAAWFPRLDEIASLLHEQIPHERIVLRLSRNIQATAQTAGLADGQIFRGTPLHDPVVFLESGLRFEADVLRGQKTGFFLDQRENRKLVESHARGRHVLNAFSFSGGFSLYAARGGARSVTDLDISAHALESSRKNFALNPSVTKCPHEFVKADAFEWLKEGPPFDLVILDPPSLAKKESERDGAIQAYGRLASCGIHRLRPDGILVAASCSAHVSASEFFDIIRNAAQESGRKFQELHITSHPPDHPATFPEANYLKCIHLGF